jgi:hypothetical protein
MADWAASVSAWEMPPSPAVNRSLVCGQSRDRDQDSARLAKTNSILIGGYHGYEYHIEITSSDELQNTKPASAFFTYLWSRAANSVFIRP